MDNLPRFIFYASGLILISSAIILFTSEFLPNINNPSYTGILFLLGYGLIYMNLVFAVSRRFMRRLNGPSSAPFIMAGIVALPPVGWVFMYDAGLGHSLWIFIFTIIFGCALGSFFGHRAGLKAQIAFQNELREYLDKNDKVPDDFKRKHDNLNKN